MTANDYAVRAIFIRHGESTGNAGLPAHDLATIKLTERGQEQARRGELDRVPLVHRDVAL